MDSAPPPYSEAGSEVFRLLSPFPSAALPLQPPSLDWQKIWQFCGFHGCRPALALALEADESCMPPSWLTASLADFIRAHAFAILQKTGDIVALSQALAAAQIRAIVFKGAVLGEQVYGGAERREFNDIDLLVEPIAKDKVADLLETLGYLPDVADPHFRRAFCDYMGQHSFRHRETGSTIDLHWNFVGKLHFTVSAAEVLRNRVMLSIGGTDIPAPCTEDLALILAGHGQKEGWASFGWALDIAKFAAAFPHFDWTCAAERARANGALRALLTSALLVEQLFNHTIDPILVAQARKKSRIADDVERIIAGYLILAERQHEDDLFGSLRLCETTWQRMRVWWGILTTRTIGDFRALPTPRGLWWVYRFTRPFRLLWQTLRGLGQLPPASMTSTSKP